MNIERKIAIVTGAAGKLGYAAANQFLQAGAKVAMLDHARGRLPTLFPDLKDSDDAFMLEGIDQTDESALEEGISSILDQFTRIDILVNTVGGYRAGKAVHETTVSDWEFLMDLNAKTAFLISRAVVPIMLSQGYGKIVHVSARPGLQGRSNMAAYSASKSAVLRLTESLSKELKHDGINVNCILPGTIDTPENRDAMPKADHSKWVKPEAIASVIQFLCSDEAGAIQGAAIPVTGRS